MKLVLTRAAKPLDALQIGGITDRDVKRAIDALADRPSAQLHLYRYMRTFFTWAARPPRRFIPRLAARQNGGLAPYPTTGASSFPGDQCCSS